MNNASSNGWTRCPPGAFGRLTATLAARRRQRLWLARLAVAAGAALAVAGSLGAAAAIDYWMYGNRPKPIVAPCPPGTPSSNPITPSGQAPATGPGCAK
jgi:hypothetical protein